MVPFVIAIIITVIIINKLVLEFITPMKSSLLQGEIWNSYAFLVIPLEIYEEGILLFAFALIMEESWNS